ncbi:tRNA uridine-5-carboxymethylaminomethyl(34) synthesis GTPase MnmE [Membranihabitans maritimus]|uniref:tRNA uridine-5-carboxymethylaminomethyl(34) synthesis GTPase MnmE n=1 Tax=Membranihabitans maritimus TaxID=2904244 RepID=UPI001F028A23|nr:tRNA uridine-5-carboxymethylaminomethyl(34) synthesis GTPase MnmE [Membranihabitans maritimus]
MNFDNQDTIVAIATPQGEGALGIIRLSGREAISIANKIFKNKNLQNVNSHTLHYGCFTDLSGEIIDEGVVSVFRAPNSYTGEEVIELSCHGSSYILQKVLEVCIQYGARMAKAGEFTLRAFLNGKMDLTQAEAVADLIASESKGAHDLAIKQMRGGFSQEIARLREQLIHFASLIELELDFSEEDVEFADRDDLKDLIRKILVFIRGLKESFQLGNVMKNGIATAIVGRPNAGKSTLLNAILKEDRAIVSDIEGTTRDTIESYINIDRVRFRLIDTAGIRDARDVIEKIGVERTMKELTSSALIIYMFDINKLSPEEVWEDLKKFDLIDKNIIVVANKMDTNPYAKPSAYYSPQIDTDNFVTLSAINEMNIPHLKDTMVRKAVKSSSLESDVIVSNSRHFEALVTAEHHLSQALSNLQSGITGDFVAMDIRHTLIALGEITGEVSTDDLLDRIFRDFCIGK